MAGRVSRRREGATARVGERNGSTSGSTSEHVVSRRSRSADWRLSTPGGSHPQVVEIQRSRLFSAAIRAVEELGYSNTSVAHITSRARVSRRTFYELFADREECLAAALQDGVGVIEREIAAAGFEGLVWRERVRLGLWVVLSFFDREPVLARVCVVQALRGDPVILARREALLTRLAAILDEGRLESARAGECTPMTAEGLVGAAFSIVYTRLLRGDSKPLTDLLGELMALIVLPYKGPAAARREQTRPAPVPLPGQARRAAAGTEQLANDPLEGISIRMTYRTTRVLECVAAYPGASNRQVGEHAGVSDQGQVSKLLARLERVGLLVNVCKDRPKGDANAWRLSSVGERVTQSIRVHRPPSSEREAS
jgi:AcrR family transcriptional regulator